MDILTHYHQIFTSFLLSNPLTKAPLNLYEPADYILSLGGKRLRPIFVLMGCGLYQKDVEKALNAAMAVEVFHNFTLLHDDIMDQANLRRGKPTVHIKYNLNTAILSGDAMMIQAYHFLLKYEDPALVKNLMLLFNKMAIEVCEGQQMDMDFETKQDVSIEEYIEMITFKTSVLIGASFQMGAMIGGAPLEDQKHIYAFAKYFGIAFQLQDDVLDAFGDSKQVGKMIGGDIVQNKKTYLYLKALEISDSSEQEKLKNHFSGSKSTDIQRKIEEVTFIYKNNHVVEYANQLIEAYRDLAFSHLNACNISDESKNYLMQLINDLVFRKS